MTLLEPHNMPFAAALGIMLVLAIVQMIGVADFGDADVDLDVDGEGLPDAGMFDGLLTLLGIGRIPLTIWLALFLLMFAGIGLSIQELAQSLTGSPLYSWLAALIAGVAALPVTGVFARPLGRIMPKDHTTAVSTESLVGRRATISIGVARAGSPARARVKDIHGQTHRVMVEPHEESSELHEGDEVLLVRREGNQFYATALAERRLSPTVNQ
ncbi:YqiJ family protein [Qipengyuania sp. 1NDW9]|uniref:YqiJ family protein n=1 Tax=Qipengyuania xiapuensis TaxID=2867236 RepID=A0ABX8ZUZ7_9SPHN|nr:YqiJ family protein [Qipengyuania xiapuensis]MBX7491825.1 YqiJ family protein [Qipengyuania xiapuensis]QZD91468.1 YqiJ family protein [Qipengyuania xiapuensis]